MISLAQLCDNPANGLQPVGGKPVAKTGLTGIHTSELDDPTPYLEGGELLLTTGIPLTGSPERVQRYVDRLATRGVVALGLGLGAGTDEVPNGLAEACAAAGVQLLLVPENVPFMQVSRAYWDLVGKTEHADLAASLSLQTTLAKAATRPEAVASVLKVLAKAVDGWAAYLPADGAAETVFPPSERRVLPLLREETLRLGLTGTPSAATFPLLGRDVIEYSIVADRRTAGFLAVCAGRPLRKADRQLMLTGGLLLAVTAQREWQLSRANAVLTATVATLILNGYVDAARLVAADLAGAPLAEQIQLLAVTGVNGENVEAVSTAELADQLVVAGAAGGLSDRIRHARLRCTIGGYSYLILESVPPRAERAHAGVSQQSSATMPASTVRAALSGPILITQATESLAQLRRWCSLAPAGQIVTEDTALSGGLSPWAAAESPVKNWIGALAGYSRSNLVETVTSYLRHHGQWEAVARELGVHRNSVRHRIGIAEQLIGADLDDPDVSAQLWLGLRALRP